MVLVSHVKYREEFNVKEAWSLIQHTWSGELLARSLDREELYKYCRYAYASTSSTKCLIVHTEDVSVIIASCFCSGKHLFAKTPCVWLHGHNGKIAGNNQAMALIWNDEFTCTLVIPIIIQKSKQKNVYMIQLWPFELAAG